MKNTMLGKEFEVVQNDNPGQSAFMPLFEGIDALAARLGMAMYAEKSLDVQYYIWRGDTTGVAVAYTLLEAADRGVRVRLLLDDLQASVHDPALLVLDEHPHIQVRMFNPSAARSFKAIELLTRFATLNRRMHNKSFIADNQLAVIGGRNIGDEYFNANPEVDFTDFDVLAAGPVVPEISTTFDLYWNSELAVPISVLYQNSDNNTYSFEEVRESLRKGWQHISTSVYAQAVRDSDFVKNIKRKEGRFYWGRAQAVADAPEKFLKEPDDNTTHLGPRLLPYIENLQSELLIVSPYFIPGDELVDLFSTLIRRGIKITILTNSFASNDVGIVHAGYSKYRQSLVDAGVHLYEYKPDPAIIKQGRKKGSGIPGSSRASLHAKVFILDRKQLFVGSMNLDPRSVNLNSELGVIIYNQELAEEMVEAITQELPQNAYRIRFVKTRDDAVSDKKIVWETIENGQKVVFQDEPHIGFFRSLGIWFMSLFVSEELL